MNEAQRSERRVDRLVSRHWWLIVVEGYGQFAFYGTESEAEEMRADKANWEGSVGTKRRVTAQNRKVREHMKWVTEVEIPRGYPRRSERERAETAAIMAANTRSPTESSG